MLINQFSFASRFVLQSTHYDQNDGESRAVYLDTQKQQLVMKELSWSDTIRNDINNNRRPQFEFPKNVTSLTSFNSKVLNERYNVDVKFEYFPLTSVEESQRSVRELRDYIPKDQTLDIINKSRIELSKTNNQFKLIKSLRKGRDQAAVYYNDVTGEIILKEIDHKKSGLADYQLPGRITFPKDLNGRKGNIHISDEDSWSAKTPYELEMALRDLEDQLDDWDLKIDRSLFNSGKLKLQQKMSQFVRVGRLRDRDDNRYYHEAWYNPSTNELVYRKIYRRSGKEYIKDEEVFSLSDEEDFQKAKSKMRRYSLYSSSQFESFRDSQISECNDVIQSFLNPIDVEDFSDITDVLHQQFLERSIGISMTITDSGRMLLQTNLAQNPLPLSIELNPDGTIKKVDFARSLTSKESEELKIIEEVGLNGKKIYTVKSFDSYNGTWDTMLSVTAEDVVGQNGNTQGKISVYVKGIKSEGDFRYDDYEKNTYSFSMRNGKVKDVGRRERLSGNVTDPYNYPVDRGGKGGFTNFLFQTFLGRDSRRSKVNDAVLEQSREALSTPEYAGLIKEEELVTLSREITNSVGQRTNNFHSSLGKIEAVAAEESYTRFGSIILERTLKDLLTTEPPEQIKSIVDRTMEGFSVCLKRSSDARNLSEANKCMEIFGREAPVDIGRDILGIKLRQADMGDIVGYSTRQYNACIQEKYYPLFNGQDNSDSDESMDIVKACLYQSFLKSLEKAIPAVIESELGEISKDMGLNLSYGEEQQRASLEKINQCIAEKGLAQKSSFGVQTDFGKLQAMDPDEFEQELFGCVNLLINDISHYVAKVGLAAKLSEIEDFTPEQRSLILSSSIDNSFSQCMNTQMGIIDNKTQEYRGRKVELTQVSNGKPFIVDVNVPSLEATECIRSLTNYTVGMSTESMIKNMIGDQKYNQLQGDSSTASSFQQCFKVENERLNDELKSVLVSEAGLPVEEKSEKVKTRDRLSDLKTASCIKDAISWASYYAAGDMVIEKLAADPQYSFIKITEQDKEVIGSFIQSCFNEQMKDFSTVDEILGNQEKVTEYCGAQMLKDRNVQKIIIDPILTKSLADGGITGEEAAPLIKVLSEGLNKNIANETTIDGVIAKASAFKEDGLLLVVREVLEGKVEEQFDGTSETNPRIAGILSSVEDQIFSASGGNYEARLRQALLDPDENKLTEVLDQLKKDATLLIAPNVIEQSAADLLKDGTFNTQEEADALVEFGKKILNDCLNGEKIGEETQDDQINRCTNKTKIEATYFVLNDRLKNTLDNHELASQYMNDEERSALLASLVNDSTKAEIARIEAIEDPLLRKGEFDNFVAGFKADSTRSVFNAMVPSIVNDQVKEPDANKPVIVRGARSLMNQCIDAYKVTSKEFYINKTISDDEFKPNDSLDECVNRARVKLTSDILPTTLRNLLGLIDSEVNQYEDLILKARLSFESCVSKRSFVMNSKLFGNAADACLNTIILQLIPEAIKELSDRNPPVIAKNVETLQKAKVCEQKVKDDYVAQTKTDISRNLETDIFFEQALNKELMPKADMDWLLFSVQQCLLNHVAPNLLDDYVARVSSDPKLEIGESQKESLEMLSQTLGNILSYRANGEKPTRLVFSIDEGASGNNETSSVNPTATSPANASGDEKSVPYLNMMMDMEPLILEYIELVNAYDPNLTRTAFAKLERDIKKYLDENNGVLNMDDLYKILVDSDLITGVIESIISQSVREETTKALVDEGASTSVVSILASKQMIGRIFGSGKGKDVIDKIRYEYLLPLMKGELESTELPRNLINDAKVQLGKDQKRGGFAEVLFSSIIQKKLDDEQAGIESGFFKYVKMSAAGWMGYNKYEDFEWGSRYSTSKYKLRNTPSGMNAMAVFANDILIPKLTGTLSTKKEEDATERITDLIKEAMDENE
tara:strand:+ start:155553 stop:161294 length:5742 start_codon:yes stop_codon:yes gene_type:complete